MREYRKILRNREARIARRLRRKQWCSQVKPMMSGGNIHYEISGKAEAITCGGIGAGIEGVDGPEGRLAATSAAVTRYRTALEGTPHQGDWLSHRRSDRRKARHREDCHDPGASSRRQLKPLIETGIECSPSSTFRQNTGDT